MKLLKCGLASILALTSTLAFAQTMTPGGSSEQTAKSRTGDPAASSANSSGDTTGMNSSRSGSGSSTSGGRDDNGDQGRDKMPDSSIDVRPYDKQNKPPK
jgi:hypothetical protein